jgi:hypothetical protein
MSWITRFFARAVARPLPALLATAALATSAPVLAWEPTKPVELVVPAGTGGGADQMARFIQGVVAKHNLMKQPIVVVNKSGGAGADAAIAQRPSQTSSTCMKSRRCRPSDRSTFSPRLSAPINVGNRRCGASPGP